MNDLYVGKYLKIFRTFLGLTQAELGLIVNVSQEQVSRWEYEHNYTVTTLLKLCINFNITPDQFFNKDFKTLIGSVKRIVDMELFIDGIGEHIVYEVDDIIRIYTICVNSGMDKLIFLKAISRYIDKRAMEKIDMDGVQFYRKSKKKNTI